MGKGRRASAKQHRARSSDERGMGARDGPRGEVPGEKRFKRLVHARREGRVLAKDMRQFDDVQRRESKMEADERDNAKKLVATNNRKRMAKLPCTRPPFISLDGEAVFIDKSVFGATQQRCIHFVVRERLAW